MINALLAVIMITLVTVFSVQNAAPVVMSFMLWKFEASLAIVIFLSLLSGVIIGAIVASLMRVKTKKKSEVTLKGEQK
ncbi:MAG: LapA family protein [Nitrospirae bacterium]|nr:LapA family protein [Nitrospirota bacterium]